MRARVIPVLLYHAVAERPRPGLERWTVPPPVFGEHLAVLAGCGRTPVTMTALAEGLRGRGPLPPSVMGITFDDGYADTWDATLSLQHRDFAVSIFVTSGWIDRPGWLTGVQLQKLSRLSGVEVGAHSVSHPRLDELGEAQLEAEVRGSRAALERHIDAEVTAFAYPHGAYDRRVRQTVVEAGFAAGVAVKNALSHAGDDPYAIARWTVTRDTTAAHLEAVLDGRGVRPAPARERARTRAFRLYRRVRRRGTERVGRSR
jgi:peptidoglycan/xylan/chitin deacetylase (PgdA/CDA1 family)